MTHDVDADGRPAELRPVPDHPAEGAFASDRCVPPDKEDAAEVRLRALQPARGTPHPARSDQAVQSPVPLADLAGAAPRPGRPDAGRRPAAVAGTAGLAAAARTLDRARL